MYFLEKLQIKFGNYRLAVAIAFTAISIHRMDDDMEKIKIGINYLNWIGLVQT